MAADQRQELDKNSGLEAERRKAEPAAAAVVAAQTAANQDENGRGPDLVLDGGQAEHTAADVAAVEAIDVVGLVDRRYTALRDHRIFSAPVSRSP